MQGSLLQARVFLHPVVAHSWRRVTYLQLITRVHRIEGADDGIDLRRLQQRGCRGRREGGTSGPTEVQPLIWTVIRIRCDIQITFKIT